MPELSDTLKVEAGTWIMDDPEKQKEKLLRERMRHYGMARALLLDKLDTTAFAVVEIGGGPLPLSDILPFRERIVIDPLSEEYKKIAPCPDHVARRAEDFNVPPMYDLAIATNSLDHVENPYLVALNMQQALKPGGYAAILCAENNAITHPHPAHEHNLTAETVHSWFDQNFETMHELTYAKDNFRYGWVSYEGRRGQPAFALLFRKCTGF